MPNILAFETPHDGLFLVFGVPNAKYLAFGIPDENALSHSWLRQCIRHCLSLCINISTLL